MQDLGRAVDLHEDIAEALLRLAQLGGTHRCRAVGQRAQRRQVVLRGLGHLQHAVDHRRHQQGVGDLLGLDIAAQLGQVGNILRHRAAAAEQRGQQPQAGPVADRRHVQEARAGVIDLLAFHVHRIAHGQPVVHGVRGALALAGGAAGEAIDQRIIAHVVLDARVRVRHAVQQIPEVQQAFSRGSGRVHADHRHALAAQHVEVAVEQRILDEDNLGADERHLPAVFFLRVAVVGVGQGRVALQCGPCVQQGNVVVFEDAQADIAAAQLQAVAHHVDDAVGQRVQLAEGVAALALDIDQGLAVAEAHGKVAHRAREIHFHSLPPACCHRGNVNETGDAAMPHPPLGLL
ncbi:hypothetical protein D3C81_1143460 [compost metagenome]